MSDDLDFMLLTRSLERDLGKRAALVRGLRRATMLLVLAVLLLGLATLLVLTNTTTLIITLTVVAFVIFELCRRGMAAEGPRRDGGRRI